MAEAVDRLQLIADHHQLRSGPRSASISRSWRRFVSWNSSTIRWLNRERYATPISPRPSGRWRGSADPRNPNPSAVPWRPQIALQTAPTSAEVSIRGIALANLGAGTDGRLDRLLVGGDRPRLAIGAKRTQLIQAQGLSRSSFVSSTRPASICSRLGPLGAASREYRSAAAAAAAIAAPRSEAGGSGNLG